MENVVVFSINIRKSQNAQTVMEQTMFHIEKVRLISHGKNIINGSIRNNSLRRKKKMSDKTFGELFRERYTIKPDCFGKIDFDSDKCGICPVLGQCMNVTQEITR